MLHTFVDVSPFQREVRRAELEIVVNPRALSTALAENYVGAFRALCTSGRAMA